MAVTISGSNFQDACEVDFGGTPVANYSVSSDGTLITAVAPPNYAGTWDVMVTTPGGTSAANSGDRLTYVLGNAPTVGTVSYQGTATSAGGTQVTLTGTGFTDATSVQFRRHQRRTSRSCPATRF